MEGLVGGPLYDIGEHDLMDVWDADFTATHDAMVSDCSSPSSSSTSSSVVSPSRSSPHSPNTASSNASPSSHLPPFIWSTDPLVRNDKLLTDDGLIPSSIKPEDAEGNAGPLALVGTGRGVVVPAVGAAGSDGDSLPQSPLSSNDMDSECYPYLSMSASAGAGAGGGGSALPSINLCPSPPPQPAAAAHSSVKQEPMDELADVALEDDDEINPKLRMDDEGDSNSSDGSSYDLSIHCNSSNSNSSSALLPNGLNLGALTPVGYVIKQGKVMSRQQQLLPSLKTVQIRRPMAPPPTVTSSPYHIGAQSLIRVSTATTSSTAAAIVLTTAKPGSGGGGGGGGGSVATTAIPVQSAAATAAGSRVVIPKINIKLDPHTGSLVSPSASPVPSLAPSAPPPLISRVTPAPPSSPQTKSQDQQKKSNSNIASKTAGSKQKSQHKVRVAAAGNGSGGGRQPITTPLISSQPKGSTGPLVLTEEEKRTLLSEGFAVPQRMPLTKQEEKSLKKIRRKIKNKISAQESRRKKKEYMDCLERKMDSLHDELVHFKGRCQALEAQNANLVLQLKQLQQQVKTFK